MFVGRGNELVRLMASWDTARSGHGHVVTIAGEPGVGKTRLCSEFSQRVLDDRGIVLYGRCDRVVAFPYQPFVEALQRYVRHAPNLELLPADGATELARRAGLGEDAQSEVYYGTLLRFANGAIGKSAAVVDCLQPYYFHSHLVGSEGSILDNKFHSEKLGGLNKHSWSQLSMKMLDSGDVSDHPYQTQFQAFFDALEQGKDMPLTSFADGYATHRVIAAAVPPILASSLTTQDLEALRRKLLLLPEPRPHVAAWVESPATRYRAGGSACDDDCLVDTSPPGQREIELRWEAICERWSQLTFFLFDAESWR